LQEEHSALLSKLEFINDLVRCVVSVAEERSSPLAQSVIIDKSSSGRGDKMFADEVQRCIEQLVLYVRALHLLASGLQLARCALKDGQLERSKTASRSQFYHCLGCYFTYSRNCLFSCSTMGRNEKRLSTGVTISLADITSAGGK